METFQPVSFETGVGRERGGVGRGETERKGKYMIRGRRDLKQDRIREGNTEGEVRGRDNWTKGRGKGQKNKERIEERWNY